MYIQVFFNLQPASLKTLPEGGETNNMFERSAKNAFVFTYFSSWQKKNKYYLVIRRYPLLLNTYNLVNNGTLRAPYTGLQFLK